MKQDSAERFEIRAQQIKVLLAALKVEAPLVAARVEGRPDWADVGSLNQIAQYLELALASVRGVDPEDLGPDERAA